MLFDRIFYINLKRRNDRNDNIINQINKYNLQSITERVEAVDGTQIDIDNISENIITQKGKIMAQNKNKRFGITLTNGGIGCALSHLSIWLKIKNDKSINSALILEDDMTFADDFINKLKFYENKINNDYDLFFLGYHPSSKKSLTHQINNFFVKSKRVYGLFGYIVTKKGAEKLVNLFPITYQIDSEISNSMNYLNIILIQPEYALIFSEPSEVATTFGSDIQIINRMIKKETFNTPLKQYQTNNFGFTYIMIDFTYILIGCFIILILILIKAVVDYDSCKFDPLH